MAELRTLYSEHKNVKFVRLYKEGRPGNYNRKTLVLDRPINQLSRKQLESIVYNVQFTMTREGEVVLQAVVI